MKVFAATCTLFRESTCCFEDERYAVAKSKGKSRSTQVRSKLAIQVGERIRKTRKQEGLSIENFALRCDIHPSYVGHIEREMQNPTLSTLERISQGLGISMEDLFKDIDTPINVENAAIRHLSQVISELSPEQTQQLLQIVDSVMAIKNEYLQDNALLSRAFSCCKKVTLYNRKQRIATYK
ncbi:MAG: helix-turn-helix domain-containing protein [Faecalibacterium prausnitzii]